VKVLSNVFEYLLDENNDKYLRKSKVNIEFIEIRLNLEMEDGKEDPRFLGLFNILEMLSGQRPGIQKIKAVYSGNKRVIKGVWKVTIRKDLLYFFLQYYVNIWLPLYLRRENFYKLVVSSENISITMKQIVNVVGMVAVVYNFNKMNHVILNVKIGKIHNSFNRELDNIFMSIFGVNIYKYGKINN
jgi:hypothetical protein